MSKSRDGDLVPRISDGGLAPHRADPLAARVQADLARGERLVRISGPEDLDPASTVISLPILHHQALSVIQEMEGISLWSPAHGQAGRMPSLVIDALYPYAATTWAKGHGIPVLRLIEWAHNPFASMCTAWRQGSDLVQLGQGNFDEDRALLSENIRIGLALEPEPELPQPPDPKLTVAWLEDDVHRAQAVRRALRPLHVDGFVGPKPDWAGPPPAVFLVSASRAKGMLLPVSGQHLRRGHVYIIEDAPACDLLPRASLTCVRGTYDRDLFVELRPQDVAALLRRALQLHRAIRKDR